MTGIIKGHTDYKDRLAEILVLSDFNNDFKYLTENIKELFWIIIIIIMEDIALIIRRIKRSGEPRLNLSGKQLISIPPEIY